MDRAQKETFVKEFSEEISKAQAFAVMSFNKLNVEQVTQFRLGLRKQGVRVQVVKNTLAKRIFADGPLKDLNPQFRGNTLIAYSSGDAVVAAKAICEWLNKENFDVQVKGGTALGQLMTTQQIVALSKLPGRKELLTGFLWALNSAPTKFLYALQDAPKRLGYAIGALQAKKEKESA